MTIHKSDADRLILLLAIIVLLGIVVYLTFFKA